MIMRPEVFMGLVFATLALLAVIAYVAGGK